jgi:hypothetical protein
MFLNESHRKLFTFLEEGSVRRERFEDRFECELGGGGGSGDSVTFTNMIPTYITGFQGWVEAYLTEAMGMMQSPGNFTAYGGETYAQQDANELAGIAALALRGSTGAVIEANGKAYLRDLYDGLKINVNPKVAAYYQAKIDALLEEFDDQVMPQIQSQFVFAYGGSDHNVAEARAAKMMMHKIIELAKAFYDDYVKERSFQHQGLAHATPYGLQCIRDGEMLRQAGAYEREYAQANYNDAWSVWSEAQIIPIRNLDIAGNAIKTILSTTRSQTTQYHKPSTMTQIAGLAVAGMSLYAMYSGTSRNPYSNPAVSAAGAEAANKAYSSDNMGFQRDNPEMIGQG